MRAYFLCLLLALLSATVHSQVPASVRDAYAKFQNQHVFPGMRQNTCNTVIRDKNIYTGRNNDECKETNTFIRAHQNVINAICKGAGERYPHGGEILTKSIHPFDSLVCVLDDMRNTRKPCRYTAKVKRFAPRIAIKCRDGWPVHFGRDILQLD